VANVPDPGEITAAGVGITALADVLMAYPRDVEVAPLGPAAEPGQEAAAPTEPTAPGAATADPGASPGG
jgi:hypothetical protein